MGVGGRVSQVRMVSHVSGPNTTSGIVVPSTPTPPHSDDQQREQRNAARAAAQARKSGSILAFPVPPATVILDEQCFSPGELLRDSDRARTAKLRLPLRECSVPLLDAVSVDIYPQLAPNEVSGLCCPAASVYNHEGFSRLRKTWPLFALLFLSAVVGLASPFADVVIDREVSSGQLLPEQAENARAAVFLHIFFIESFLWCASAMFYFCAYRPELQIAPRPPTLLARALCPIPTVFYHEGNEANETCCFATFFGCFYTLVCWTPFYMKGRGEDSAALY